MAHPPKAGFPAGWPKKKPPKKAPPKKAPPKKSPPKTTVATAPTGPTVEQQAAAQANAYIKMLEQQVQLEMDAYQKDLDRQAQLERDRSAALAKAIQDMGLPAAIGNIFGSAAQSQAGLASGFSGDLQASANQQASEMNNILSGTGQEARNQGVNIGDVVYGTGGFIPAQTFNTSGAGFAAQAALQPAFALEQGLQNAARVIAEAQPNIQQYITEKAKARTQYPQAYQEALGRIQTTKQNLQSDVYNLYNAGLITQREMGRRLGVKGWAKLPNYTKTQIDAMAAAAGKGPITRSLGGYLYQYDPRTGKWVPVAGQGPTPKIYQQGGYFWTIDPKSGKFVVVGGTGPAAKTPAAPKIFGSDAAGRFAMVPTANGGWKIIPIIPPVKGSGSKKPRFTPVQQNTYRGRAATFADQIVNGFTDKNGVQHPPITDLETILMEFEKTGIPPSIGLPIVLKYFKQAHPLQAIAMGAQATLAGINSLYQQYIKSLAGGNSKKGSSGNQNSSYPSNMPTGLRPGKNAYGGGIGTVVNAAISQIGKPYVFGSGPDTSSFDCSDLIQWVYGQAGYSLPRDTYGQIKVGRRIKNGQPLQAGDLIFSSPNHVVLYVGNGWVIAAPHTGEVVQYQPLSNFKIYAIRRILPTTRIVV